MAYYDDGYIWAQEHTTYFPIANQDPVSFSSYESYCLDTNYDAYDVSVFHEPESIDHGDYHYDYNYNYDYDNCQNWYSSSDPTINYFAHNYVKPKLIVYEPVECDTDYVTYHTQHSISYSQVNSGFNDPEFEEYDPTPYGGGYDIISEYGKPLPPSDQTCYPRSKPKRTGHTPMSSPESQPPTKYSPEPVAVIRPRLEPEPKPEPEARPEPNPEPKSKSVLVPIVVPGPEIKPMPEPKAEPVPVHEPEPSSVHALGPMPDPFGLIEVGEKERDGYTYPNYGYDYPWPEYDRGNTFGVGYDYGYGKQVVQIPPCEYSPEVVDLCENIFGSWPCLARIRKQQMCSNNKPTMTCNEVGHLNPWEECANYIFGRSMTSYNV